MSAKIAAALHEVMTKVGYVQKTGKNDFHGYKYAGEADLLEVLRPAMVEAGLILLPSVQHVSPIDEHGNVMVMLEYTLVHKDGDVWPEKIGAVGMGNDRAKNGNVGDKGVYKAITGANKYVLFKLFQIETGDDPEVSDTAEKVRETDDTLPKAKSRALYTEMQAELDACLTVEQLGLLWRSAAFQNEFKKLKADWQDQLTEHKDRLKEELSRARPTVAPNFDAMETANG